jgi:hypothetical protein
VKKVLNALVVALSFAGNVSPQAPINDGNPEQLVFRAGEKAVDHPVPLPRDVFDILVRAGVVPPHFEDGRAVTPENVPPSWFSASIVHLAGKKEKDLLVMGIGGIREGNVTSFWIFRPEGKTFQLLLAGSVALRLEIKETRTHGYRDIDITSLAAVDEMTSHLRFRDGSYQRVGGETEHLE